MKVREVRQMFDSHSGDECLWRDALFFGAEHNGRAMGIIGTHVVTCVADEFLETYPYVRLNVFDKVSDMNASVCIRKGASD